MYKQQNNKVSFLVEPGIYALGDWTLFIRMGKWRFRYIQQPHKNVWRKSLSGANKLENYIIKQNTQIRNVFLCGCI